MICETEAVHAARMKVIKNARALVECPFVLCDWKYRCELARALLEMDKAIKAASPQSSLGIDPGKDTDRDKGFRS